MAIATTMVTTMDIPTQSMRLAMKPAPIPVSPLMKRYVSITRSPWLASYLPKQHIHHKHSLNGKPKPKGNFDLALMGVFIHIMGDCANNLGVIIAGLVIWLADYHGRYYADPAVSMAIAVMIFVSSLPLSRLLSILKTCFT